MYLPNGVDAVYGGSCVPLGINNFQLSATLTSPVCREPLMGGLGVGLEAFVIPETAPTITEYETTREALLIGESLHQLDDNGNPISYPCINCDTEITEWWDIEENDHTLSGCVTDDYFYECPFCGTMGVHTIETLYDGVGGHVRLVANRLESDEDGTIW